MPLFSHILRTWCSDTQNFVDELFSKFAPESTAAATPATTIPPPLNIPGLDAAVGPAGNSQPIEAYDPTTPLDLSNKTTNGFNKSRKRSYNDRFGPVNGQDPQHAGSSRAPKVHRGSRGGRDDPNNGRNSHIVPPAPQRTKFSHNPTLAGMPSPPTPPPGFPSFNPNDPIGAMLAMQAMFPQMSGGKAINSPLPPKVNQRCKDYDVKGFCVMGSACPYDHGNDPVVASSKAEEYDPNNASISPRLTVNGHRGRGASARNRGLDRGARGKGDQNSLSPRYDSRASFSDPKPNFDRSNTTVVVEQIPEENFEEGSVREFFSQYGSVKEVTMRPYKRLAIVQYRDYISARRAYDSPKVIFDNRFVKVYWYKSSEDKKINGTALRKSTSGPRLSSAKQSQTSPDEPSEQANVLSQQAEAQKNYETKAKARKEMSEAKAALIRKQEEITKKADNERAELLAKIAAKEGKKPDAELPKAAATNDAKAAQDEEVNRALREQLAKLEAEAKSLGIDPNAPHDEPYPSYGGYRGRGGARQFSSRGRGGFRGNSSYRGSWTSTRGGSSVRRLDNRPKRVAVSGVEWTPEKDECLREHLVVSIYATQLRWETSGKMLTMYQGYCSIRVNRPKSRTL